MPIYFALCFIVKVKDTVSSYHYLEFCWDTLHLWSCGFVDNPYTFPLRLCYYNPWVILWENQTFHCQIFRWTKVSLYKEADKFCKLISPVKVAAKKVEPTTKGSLWMEGPMKLYMVLAFYCHKLCGTCISLEPHLYVNAITKALKNEERNKTP